MKPLEGSHALSPDGSTVYAVDYARPSDHGTNPASINLDYGRVSGGLKRGPLTGTLAVERLEGNGTQAFQTPLATLHAFQGWADVFLTRPSDGLRDVSTTISYAIAHLPVRHSTALTASWRDVHDADPYDRELDLSGQIGPGSAPGHRGQGGPLRRGAGHIRRSHQGLGRHGLSIPDAMDRQGDHLA